VVGGSTFPQGPFVLYVLHVFVENGIVRVGLVIVVFVEYIFIYNWYFLEFILVDKVYVRFHVGVC